MTGAAAGATLGYVAAGPVLDGLAKPTEPECLPGAPNFPTGAVALVGGQAAWTTDFGGTTITARPRPGRKRGRSIDVGGAPVDIAIAPGGRRALVSTGFYDRPGLALVDLRSGGLRRVAAGDAPGAVAFAPAGDLAYVVGGGPEGTLSVVRPRSGKVERTISVGSHPRGLAISADGDRALIALNGGAALAVVDLRRMRVHLIETPAYPGGVAATGAGRALVTHDGLGARSVSAVDLSKRAVVRTTKVGDDPAAIAAAGSKAVVVTRSGRAVVLDGRGKRRRSVNLGGRPEAVAVWRGLAWVADGRTGRLRRVRVGAIG